jgi:hypothetical protein
MFTSLSTRWIRDVFAFIVGERRIFGTEHVGVPKNSVMEKKKAFACAAAGRNTDRYQGWQQKG